MNEAVDYGPVVADLWERREQIDAVLNGLALLVPELFDGPADALDEEPIEEPTPTAKKVVPPPADGKHTGRHRFVLGVCAKCGAVEPAEPSKVAANGALSRSALRGGATNVSIKGDTYEDPDTEPAPGGEALSLNNETDARAARG